MKKTKKMEQYKPGVSIILPGWNEGQVILNCISNLKKQTYQNFNVFMILGGNDPFILQAKKDDWNNLIILDQIEPNKNKALNLALLHPAIAEILIFSDIDCEFPIDFVEKYTRQFENSEKNIIAGRVH